MSFLDRGDMERILGYHDGARIDVTSEALNSRSVLAHEAIHGRLFHETPDGGLHRACCLAAGSDYDRRLGGIHAKLAGYLFNDTREAHEAAATYLGILGLKTAAERAAEYGKLPDDYRRYHAILAEPIDPISKSSWLRYSFAWTLSHWAFHSMRSVHFFDVETPDLGTVERVKGIPSPSGRMSEAIRLLEGKQLMEWRDTAIAGARALCEERGVKLWDLDEDEEWEAREECGDTKVLENYLNHKAGHWLLDNLAIETIDYRDPDPKLGPGFGKLMTELGHHVVSYHRGRDTELELGARPFLLRRLAFERGDDSISHRPWCVPQDISAAEELMDEAARCLLNASDVFFISDIGHAVDDTDGGSDPDRMLVLFQSSQESSLSGAEPYYFSEVGSYRVPFELALRFAQAFISRKRAGGLQKIRMWVLLSSNRNTLREMADRSIAFSFDLDAVQEVGPEEARVVPPEQIMLYWHDNWALLDEYAGTRVTALHAAFADSDAEPKRLSVRVARLEGMTFGFVIAAKNAWAGVALDDYEEDRVASGKQTRLDMPGDLVITETFAPLVVAWTAWPRF